MLTIISTKITVIKITINHIKLLFLYFHYFCVSLLLFTPVLLQYRLTRIVATMVLRRITMVTLVNLLKYTMLTIVSSKMLSLQSLFVTNLNYKLIYYNYQCFRQWQMPQTHSFIIVVRKLETAKLYFRTKIKKMVTRVVVF